MYYIYCDGGNNALSDKKGVWAFAVIEHNKVIDEHYELIEDATNSRVEILALYNSLLYAEQLNEPCIIRSDSQYVVNSYNDWVYKWAHNGWRKADGGEVAHQDLWEKINEIRHAHIVVEWVKGHGTDKWNNYVDKLTQIGRKKDKKKEKKKKKQLNKDNFFLWFINNLDEFEEEDFDTIINLITTYEEKQGKVSRQDMAFRH